MIQDASLPRPLYTNLVNGTIGICRTEGLGGVYRGLWPTVRLDRSIIADRQIMKQGANSAVRFTSYGFMQQNLVSYLRPSSGKLSSTATFIAGAGAGLITVCEWRDNVSLNALTGYRHDDATRQH